MTSHEHARISALENQAFALMGRLHVLMRRETGRITDIEYMRIDRDYCRHLIQLAAQSEQADLQKIGERLHDIYFGEEGLFVIPAPRPPLVDRIGKAATSPPAPASPATEAPLQPATANGAETPAKSQQTYVGRLR